MFPCTPLSEGLPLALISLYLVNIKLVDNLIKHGIEVVEHVYHLHGSTPVADCSKSHDVTEEDCHAVECSWKNILKIIGNKSRCRMQLEEHSKNYWKQFS